MNLLFSNPLYLWLLPISLVFLIYIYLNQGPGKELLVSTTLFLEKIKSKSSSKKKFVPPFLFFLELLILSLLVFCSAGPISKFANDKKIILIDNSFSLNARPGLPFGESKLIDLSKKTAKELINSNSNINTKWKIYTLSPNIRPQTESFVSQSIAKEKIKKINTSFSKEIFDLKNIKENFFEEIFLISDQKVNLKSENKTKISNLNILEKNKINNLSNIAFTNLKNDVYPKVKISSFAAKKVEVDLSAESYKDINNPNQVYKKNFILYPEETMEISINANLNLYSPLKISFSIGEKDQKLDSILEDNTLWIQKNKNQSKLYLVSDLDSQTLGINNLPLNLISSSSYENLEFSNENSFIFHLLTPEALPENNSIFILPPKNSKIIKFEESFGLKHLTFWDENHPLLSYINFNTFKPQAKFHFKKDYWHNSILQSADGSVLLAGTKNKNRYAFMAFDVFPYQPKKRKSNGIFLLNLINWLNPDKLNTNYNETYSNFNFTKNNLEFLSEKGLEEITLNSLNLFTPKEPGIIYQSKKAINAINFLEPSESNLKEKDSILINIKAKKVKKEKKTNSFVYILSLILLILLLFHYFLVCRK